MHGRTAGLEKTTAAPRAGNACPGMRGRNARPECAAEYATGMRDSAGNGRAASSGARPNPRRPGRTAPPGYSSSSSVLPRRSMPAAPGEVAVDARDALDLALGGEPLVEALDAEALGQIGPRGEPLGPAPDAVVLGVGVDGGEVGADPEQRLDRDRLSKVERTIAGGPKLSAGVIIPKTVVRSSNVSANNTGVVRPGMLCSRSHTRRRVRSARSCSRAVRSNIRTI